MTASPWQIAAPSETFDCDLAIVGAGIAGLSAALEAGERGRRTIVLERSSPGAGASGRNAGYLIRGAADNYAAGCREWGRDRAREVWELTEENHRGLRDLGAAEQPGYSRLGSCVVAFEPRELAELQESRELLVEDGFDSDWIAPGECDDSLWSSGRALGGLVNPADAVCSPMSLLAMIEGALGASARVLRGANVFRIGGSDTGRVGLWSARGVVRAERVLICTNAYAGQLIPALSDIVVPRRGQMLQVEAGDTNLRHAYYANHGSEYFRPGPEGTILVGGCRTYFAEREVGFEDSVTTEVQDALERFAAEAIGARGRVVRRWSGTMGFSPDGLPLVGPLDVEGVPAGAVWFCGGFTGHGMSMAHVTARRCVADLELEKSSAFALSRLAEQKKKPPRR